jgi:hypothetical protein
MEEEFLRMHSKKTIAELKDLQEDGLFTVYGAVSGIVQDQEWWYPACKCHRSVVPDSGAYFCNGCAKHVFQIVPRYFIYLYSIFMKILFQLFTLGHLYTVLLSFKVQGKD